MCHKLIRLCGPNWWCCTHATRTHPSTLSFAIITQRFSVWKIWKWLRLGKYKRYSADKSVTNNDKIIRVNFSPDSGFGPDPRTSKFEIRSRVPVLTSQSNYKSTMNLFSLPITTEGISNTTLSECHWFYIYSQKDDNAYSFATFVFIEYFVCAQKMLRFVKYSTQRWWKNRARSIWR